LQACLGLEVDGRRQRIQIRQPRLPAGIDRLQLRRLAVGEQLIDLTFQRLDRRVVAFIETQQGPQPVSVDICL
jgi:hypothetical protein